MRSRCSVIIHGSQYAGGDCRSVDGREVVVFASVIFLEVFLGCDLGERVRVRVWMWTWDGGCKSLLLLK